MASQPSLPNISPLVKWLSRNAANYNAETGIGIAQVLLTAAQLLALKTTPIQIIPATVITGEIVALDRIHLSYNFVTTPYTLNAGTFKLFYGTTANAHALCADQSTNFLTAAANRKIIGIQPLVVAADTVTNTVNQAIFAGNDGAANYTLGDATVTVTIEFSITTP